MTIEHDPEGQTCDEEADFGRLRCSASMGHTGFHEWVRVLEDHTLLPRLRSFMAHRLRALARQTLAEDMALVDGNEWALADDPAHVIHWFSIEMSEFPIDDRTAQRDDTHSHVETLVDLARKGQEQDFRDLARCLGVREDLLEELWVGAQRRAQ